MYSNRDQPRQGHATEQIAESDKEVCLEEGQDDSLNAGSDTDEAPDGGLAAWLVVVGAWCASFCGYGWINSKSSSSRPKCASAECTVLT